LFSPFSNSNGEQAKMCDIAMLLHSKKRGRNRETTERQGRFCFEERDYLREARGKVLP
jgi:hypothetical protein